MLMKLLSVSVPSKQHGVSVLEKRIRIFESMGKIYSNRLVVIILLPIRYQRHAARFGRVESP